MVVVLAKVKYIKSATTMLFIQQLVLDQTQYLSSLLLKGAAQLQNFKFWVQKCLSKNIDCFV